MHTCGKVTDGEKTISLTVVYVHSVRCNFFIIMNLDFFPPVYVDMCEHHQKGHNKKHIVKHSIHSLTLY